MSLLREVLGVLDARGIDHALIGAVALAVHGVSRATADIDLFTVEEKALDPELWMALQSDGASVRLLKGDFEDPLAGSVRLTRDRLSVVDIVVGRYAWQKEIVESAERTSIGETEVKVARPAGIVLLKLYAGGPKDSWDIRALMETREDWHSIESEVNRVVKRLPAECRDLWNQLTHESGP
jgi:predicted nucleotidyltransferase